MKTQAWGWLGAAVLAAGLNATYHDGGMQWAHEIVDRVTSNTSAVLALATGNADQFVNEARVLTAQTETRSCPLATALARVQTRIAGSETEFARFEVMTAREQAALARIEANRARIEARVARIRIPAVAMNQIVVPSPRVSVCPRMRVNVPRVKIPAIPMVQVEMSGTGPV